MVHSCLVYQIGGTFSWVFLLNRFTRFFIIFNMFSFSWVFFLWEGFARFFDVLDTRGTMMDTLSPSDICFIIAHVLLGRVNAEDSIISSEGSMLCPARPHVTA